MPHCIVECSPDFDRARLMTAVLDGCVASDTFQKGDIKVRICEYDFYETAGKKESFIHVNVRILSGRTEAQRLHVSKTVLNALAPFTKEKGSYSVEVIEMEKAVYQKIIN